MMLIGKEKIHMHKKAPNSKLLLGTLYDLLRLDAFCKIIFIAYQINVSLHGTKIALMDLTQHT